MGQASLHMQEQKTTCSAAKVLPVGMNASVRVGETEIILLREQESVGL